MANSFLSQLNWRHATKSFDKNKKVDQETLDKIIEAIRMVPTSHGLQVFHFYVVEDQGLKDKLTEYSYNQAQVSESSHVIVMCYRTDALKRVSEYLQLIADEKLVPEEKFEVIEKSMTRSVTNKSKDQIVSWASRQVYIALGFAMAACAELGVDSCPMEGFQPDKVDELLNLPESHKSVLLLPIGYRAKEPSRKKIRFPKEDLFTFI